MANTTTAVVEALKYNYGEKKLKYLFNQESVTYKILEKDKKGLGGRGQFIVPLIVKNPGGFSGISEGGTLPTILDMDTAEASFSLQEYVANTNLTWKLIQDARNDKFAFQTALSMVEDGVRRRIFQNLNSDFIGTGKGELFTITGADASTVVTSYYLPRVQVGQTVDVMDLSDDDAKVGTALTVEGVDPIARTIDLSGALSGEAAGDYGVIPNTTDVGTSSCLHTNGLLGIIDDANPAAVVGNYGGINRSTAGNEFWKAAVLSNSGSNRSLTEDLLIQGLDQAREKGGGSISAFLTNLAITRRYHEILAAERFFALSAPGTLSGGIGRKQGSVKDDGMTPYQFSGIPWHVDPYFTNNTIVGLDLSQISLGVGENETPQMLHEVFDNVPMFKRTTSATFEIEWYFQCELISSNPAAHIKFEDIAES